MTWGLGLALGDEIDYLDEAGQSAEGAARGQPRRLGVPGQPRRLGVRAPAPLPVDAVGPAAARARPPRAVPPMPRTASVGRSRPSGSSVESTAERLARFNSVQGTYLADLRLLGWLGMLIATLGLAVVVGGTSPNRAASSPCSGRWASTGRRCSVSCWPSTCRRWGTAWPPGCSPRSSRCTRRPGCRPRRFRSGSLAAPDRRDRRLGGALRGARRGSRAAGRAAPALREE